MIKLQNLLTEAHNTRIIKIANSKNKKEIADIRSVLKNATWTDKEITAAVKKYKDEEAEALSKTYEALPRNQKDWTYEHSTHKKYEDARKDWIKKFGTKKWNAREYRKWIKDQQGNGGRNHSYDMAQNAKHEKGLLQYVQKQIKKDWGDESPLERIQWDIEA